MGQDSWNLMFGQSYPSRTRKGTETSLKSDLGYGERIVPGYAGADRSRIVKKRAKVPPRGRKVQSEELLPVLNKHSINVGPTKHRK